MNNDSPVEDPKLHARLKRLLKQSGPIPSAIGVFREIVYNFFDNSGRSFPWRNTEDPYHILISEIMLQQTQTDRVVRKYGEFLEAFPDFLALADAPFSDVLRVWQGMGYNRRAKALKAIAEKVVAEFDNDLPQSVETLATFPGIGRATASAICAFAFNQPTVFIETNIRRVFIHFFFPYEESVKDAQILPLVEKALDTENPRKWYSALMDYGTMLKKKYPNPNRRSAHYQRQSPFEGSDRQIRGMILKTLLATPNLPESRLVRELGKNPKRTRGILRQLQEEGFIREEEGMYRLA